MLGIIVVGTICVILLGIGGLSMTGPGQLIQTIINEVIPNTLASVSIGIFDLLIAIPFLLLPQFLAITVCLCLHRGNILDVVIALTGASVAPIIFYHLNDGDMFCLGISIVVYIASLAYIAFCSYMFERPVKNKDASQKKS